MIVAHIFGLPVEEAIPQLVPAGVVGFVLLRRLREQRRRWTTRAGRLGTRRKPPPS